MELPFTLPLTPNRRSVAPGVIVEAGGENIRRVIIGGARVFEYNKEDRFYNNLAIAVLANTGCRTKGLAEGFGVHRNTIGRISGNVEKFGLAGLLDGRAGPSGPTKRTPKMTKRIAVLYKKGLTASEIQAELHKRGTGISLRSVRRCLAEIRESYESKPKAVSVGREAEQMLLPKSELLAKDPEEILPASLVSPLPEESPYQTTDLQDVLLSSQPECVDSTLPAVCEEAQASSEKAAECDSPKICEPKATCPPFQPESGKGISYAGAFLAWPYLSLLGIFPLVSGLYGQILQIGGRLYGLVQSIASFFFLTLLGHRTLESFKVIDQEGFRRLIGTRATPTVKTLRDKLGVLSAVGKGYDFVMGLAKRYLAVGMCSAGVLYFDGHFIPYFGKRRMGKGYYTIRRLAHPGRVQHFVNSRDGRPLFFLLREANESFVKIIPDLIKETHSLIGESQVTFIYDRGGYSGPVFKKIEEAGDLFITYKKGKFRSIPGGAFRSDEVVVTRWGKQFKKTYDLWEGKIAITGYGNARLVLVKKNGDQTPIITNDKTRSAVEIASLMFDRWSQENFFKYMSANFSLDELATQRVEDAPTPMVTNPRWLELDEKIRRTRKKIRTLERAIGQIASKEKERKSPKDRRKDSFVRKVAALKRAENRLRKLLEEKKDCPKSVLLSTLQEGTHKVIPKEGKIILDAVKLAVYNAEEWLLDLMQPHYRDWRDPRVVLRAILRQKGDIVVKGDTVRVRLHRFGNPAYQKAAIGLCRQINRLEPKFWDGKWQLKYDVAE